MNKEEEELCKNTPNDNFEYLSYDRIIVIATFGEKSDKLIKKLTKTVDNIPNMSTEKINQINSIMDQMSKLIEDVLEEK